MKKMNNKGFAISTLLYGLLLVGFLVVALLMSIMSTNRKNTSTLIKKIEEELNRYSQTTTEFTSTDGPQEFIVPYGKAGWYKIELWGAAAKGISSINQTSNGRGSYTSGIIYLEENQHLYFQIGNIGGATPTNNGGGSVVGGATDVRLRGGSWNDSAGQNSRIMIAAGGGTSSAAGAGHSSGLSTDNNGKSYISGYNSQKTIAGYSFINTIMQNGVNDGAGKATIELISTNSKDNPPSKKNANLNSVRYIKDCITGTSTSTYERWTEIQAFNSNGENVALNKAAYYYNGSTTTAISYLTNSETAKISGTLSSGTGEKCVIVDLGSIQSLEEIVIYHNFYSGETKYTKETVSVSTTSLTSGYTVIKTLATSLVPVETTHGLRISARHLEGATVSSGNYYIQSAKSENRVISSIGVNALLNLNNGSKSQRWAITPIDGTYYKIIEASGELALQPADGAQEISEAVGTNDKYGDHAWEAWKIISLGNGYYQFQSKVTTYHTLCISAPSDTRDTSGILHMETCNASDEKQWFKLLNADY